MIQDKIKQVQNRIQLLKQEIEREEIRLQILGELAVEMGEESLKFPQASTAVSQLQRKSGSVLVNDYGHMNVPSPTINTDSEWEYKDGE